MPSERSRRRNFEVRAISALELLARLVSLRDALLRKKRNAMHFLRGCTSGGGAQYASEEGGHHQSLESL